MKTLILGLIFLLAISCNNSDDSDSFVPETITPFFIGSGNLYGDGSENILPGNLIITNQADWNVLLTKIDTNPNTSQTFTTTNINFNDYQILAVFDVIRPNSGRAISITNIIENQNSINVTVIPLGPGGAINVITQPFYIVRIPKSTKPIIFQ